MTFEPLWCCNMFYYWRWNEEFFSEEPFWASDSGSGLERGGNSFTQWFSETPRESQSAQHLVTDFGRVLRSVKSWENRGAFILTLLRVSGEFSFLPKGLQTHTTGAQWLCHDLVKQKRGHLLCPQDQRPSRPDYRAPCRTWEVAELGPVLAWTKNIMSMSTRVGDRPVYNTDNHTYGLVNNHFRVCFGSGLFTIPCWGPSVDSCFPFSHSPCTLFSHLSP